MLSPVFHGVIGVGGDEGIRAIEKRLPPDIGCVPQFKSIFFQFQILHRRSETCGQHCRVKIIEESRNTRLAGVTMGPAFAPGFKDESFQACLSQIGGTTQAVDAASYNDNIIIGHVYTSFAKAALEESDSGSR